MPRPVKPRLCRAHSGDRVFKPRSVPLSELKTLRLELGELEAMRCYDLDGLDQEQTGERMGVSRGTVQRLLTRGRAKVTRALVEGAAVIIEEAPADEARKSHRKHT
jgi:predicted DNA-binding protein (UPF0251 family)